MMVSFQCEGCGDVLTKKKLDSHLNRCRNASFTCLDCMTQFFGFDYRKHTSCISEAQKYEGSLYSGKKQPPPKPGQKPKMSSRQAYVEDAPETPEKQLSKVAAPPKAPTPPPAIPPNFSQHGLNVFDFMVRDDQNGKDDSSDDAVSSSYKSFSDASSSSISSSPSPSVDSQHMKVARQKSQLQSYEQLGYVYGNGPIEPSLHGFDSGLDLATSDLPNGLTATYKTPAPNRNLEQHHQSASRSDKKRKRTDLEDLQMIDNGHAENRNGILHSGLTGGLDRLLENPEDDNRIEPSPLSPKKRSKKSKESDALVRTKKEHHTRSSNHDGRRDDKNQKKVKNDTSLIRRRTKESRSNNFSKPRMKQIEYNLSKEKRSVQSFGQSNSDFFLSLVNKDRRSVKGQSIWGTLKTFHQGLNYESSSGPKGDVTLLEILKARDPAERRLLKGLRLKLNKRGEVVVFSRPEAEIET